MRANDFTFKHSDLRGINERNSRSTGIYKLDERVVLLHEMKYLDYSGKKRKIKRDIELVIACPSPVSARLPYPTVMDLSPILAHQGDENNISWSTFWFNKQTIAWFLVHGYRLFSKNESFDEAFHFHETSYPYPHHSETLMAETLMSRRVDSTRAVAVGHDSMRRPIAIKFIRGDSDEIKCLQFIHSLDLDQTRESCILPTLELIPYEEHWFAVMPQWTGMHPMLNCMTLGDVLEVMHGALKALKFLHEHKIFHRDIKISNFVFNFLPEVQDMGYYMDGTYMEMQAKKQLLYAIIDFGLSVKFPDHYMPEQCRLPYTEAWCGTFYWPSDCMQGEFDFDPFAFEVGTLGIMFADEFQYLTPRAPMLAPLIDKMVTRDIRNRFTASEALQFFEEMRVGLTDEQLSTETAKLGDDHGYTGHYESYDRWANLPSDFVSKWSKYREPPLPLSVKALRAACSIHPKIHQLIVTIKRVFGI